MRSLVISVISDLSSGQTCLRLVLRVILRAGGADACRRAASSAKPGRARGVAGKGKISVQVAVLLFIGNARGQSCEDIEVAPYCAYSFFARI